MIRIGVCDDNEICLELTKTLLENWANEANVEVEISLFENGEGFIENCNKAKFDVVFLDIIMPEMDGMEVAHIIRSTDKDMKIVFLTSSANYAVESYDVKAAGYCLKPVSYDRIKNIMDSFIEENKNENKPCILVKVNGGYQKIYQHEIEYIEAQNKQVEIVLVNKSLVIHNTISSYEELLKDNDNFYRCHRSFLVYLPNIDFIDSSHIQTKSGKTIPIARGVHKDFKKYYQEFIQNQK